MAVINTFAVSIIAAIALASGAYAESHTVAFQNNCGFGTPLLMAGGTTFSTGETVLFEEPLISAIAFLQTGGCGQNGESCTLVELTLRDPQSPGAGSAADISLVPPHSFSVTSGFGYFDGCQPAGLDCTGPGCSGAFTDPTNGLIVPCEVDGASLAVTFCD